MAIKTVDAELARQRWDVTLENAARGETSLIVRDGHETAVLVPHEEWVRLQLQAARGQKERKEASSDEPTISHEELARGVAKRLGLPFPEYSRHPMQDLLVMHGKKKLLTADRFYSWSF